MRQYQQNICYVMDGSVPVARCACEEDAQAIVERLNNLADALDASEKARREAERDARTLAEFVDLLRFKSCPCGRDLSAKESEATVRTLARSAEEGRINA